MARNYLKRLVGDEIYALLTASAFNFRRWLRIVELLPNFLSQWIDQFMYRTLIIRFLKPHRNNRVNIGDHERSQLGNFDRMYSMKMAF